MTSNSHDSPPGAILLLSTVLLFLSSQTATASPSIFRLESAKGLEEEGIEITVTDEEMPFGTLGKMGVLRRIELTWSPEGEFTRVLRDSGVEMEIQVVYSRKGADVTEHAGYQLKTRHPLQASESITIHLEYEVIEETEIGLRFGNPDHLLLTLDLSSYLTKFPERPADPN